MSPPREDSGDSNSLSNRRTFLRATGTFGTLAFTGLSGSATAQPDDEKRSEDDEASESEDGSVKVYEGITFAKRDVGEMKLDLFVPAFDSPPLVVYIHGGAWKLSTRDNVPPKRYAREMGVAIASVDYRLSEIPEGVDPEFPIEDNPTPRGVSPDHFVDVKASIRWLRAHADEYGYDAEQVVAWGASSGGHLAFLAGFVDDVKDLTGEAYSEDELTKEVAPDQSGAVQAVIDWYGVADLTRLQGEPGSSEALLIGGSKSENQAKFEAATPLTHISSDDPPVLAMHGRNDEYVSIEHSRALYETLDEAGVDTVFYELDGLNHVFGRGGEETIQSERVAMSLLTKEPRPAQSIYETAHMAEGGSPAELIGRNLPAGPRVIRRFIYNTIAPDRSVPWRGRGPRGNGNDRGRGADASDSNHSHD